MFQEKSRILARTEGILEGARAEVAALQVRAAGVQGSSNDPMPSSRVNIPAALPTALTAIPHTATTFTRPCRRRWQHQKRRKRPKQRRRRPDGPRRQRRRRGPARR
jgi:hypothetical protein